MAKQVQLRRGTTTDHSTFTGVGGEVTVDIDKNTVVVHDGATAGGFPLAKENNPTFTGDMTMSTPGSYIEFGDGTRQYTAVSTFFYMILPGILYTPLFGTSRYYPDDSISINTIKYNLGTPGTSDILVNVLVDDFTVQTFTIPAGVYKGSETVAITVNSGSYLTLNVDTGSGAVDIILRFAYTI